MSAEHEPLILDLVEWVARKPRPYAEVMDAWRTSCPRLPVWEDAVERGLVERRADAMVSVTTTGLDYLERNGRPVREAGGAAATVPPRAGKGARSRGRAPAAR
jgi:hypothetical protein